MFFVELRMVVFCCVGVGLMGIVMKLEVGCDIIGGGDWVGDDDGFGDVV